MQNDKVVIVTGASRGVGAETACLLAASGVGVVLAARAEDALKTVEQRIRKAGGQALSVAADVADADAGERILARAREHFGRVDALVNNAGLVAPLSPIAEADPAAWRYSIAVNLLGPFYLVRACLDDLRRRRGRVVNVSSGAAETVIEAAGAYCTAKAGLNHFTRVLAAEEPDVVCVAVRPGVVDTGMQEELRRQGPAAMPAATADFYRRLKEEGRLIAPQVPARAIAYLALAAPTSMSGRFVSYDDPDVAGPARAMFNNG